MVSTTPICSAAKPCQIGNLTALSITPSTSSTEFIFAMMPVDYNTVTGLVNGFNDADMFSGEALSDRKPDGAFDHSQHVLDRVHLRHDAGGLQYRDGSRQWFQRRRYVQRRSPVRARAGG